MFDSLDETIRPDDRAEITNKDRIAKVVVVSVLSVLLFSALFFAVRMLE
jgi:hypothetical protein